MPEDKTIIAEPGHTIANLAKRQRACLVQYNGARMGKRYILEAEAATIGRQPGVDILIDEPSVSRNHARIYKVVERFEIEDLKSSNGTYINEMPSQGRQVIQDLDLIRLGSVLLKFFAHDNIDSIVQDQIYKMATIDSGTGIFNKQYLGDTLASEFRIARTSGRELSIVYFDLDFFKKVNDTYGHNAGDFILREGAAVAKDAIRRDDILARFGGEEFVVILPNTDADEACDLAERVRFAFERYVFRMEIEIDGVRKRIEHRQTISLGVAAMQDFMTGHKDLLETADQKLLLSKQGGRNRVTR